MLPRLLRHCYCYADSRFSNPIVPARTRQGKSSRFDVLIRPSDASGNSFPRTLPMHKVELRRQVGALVRGKNGRGFSRHAGGLFVRCGEKCEAHQVIPYSARFRFTWFRCFAYPLSGSVLRTPQNSGQEEVWANSRSAAHTRACGNDRKNRWRKRSPRLPNLSHSVSGFARLVF